MKYTIKKAITNESNLEKALKAVERGLETLAEGDYTCFALNL